MTELMTCPRCKKRKPAPSFVEGISICCVCALPTMGANSSPRRRELAKVYRQRSSLLESAQGGKLREG